MKNAAMQRPKVVTITYAQGDMHQLHAQRQQMHLGGELADQLSGFEWVGHTIYSQSDLDLSLVNPDILKQRRGAGFWCWKPAILLQALNSLDADYVFYMDANERPTANHVKTLLQACGVSKFAGFRFHPRQWPSMRPYTKRDCFVGMQCDSEKFWDATKVHAGFICFRVSDAAALFLKEWNFYCSIPELVTDMPSVAPNFEEFIEHRHDQSILTNLVTLVLDKNTRDLMELLTQDIEIPAEYS